MLSVYLARFPIGIVHEPDQLEPDQSLVKARDLRLTFDAAGECRPANTLGCAECRVRVDQGAELTGAGGFWFNIGWLANTG